MSFSPGCKRGAYQKVIGHSNGEAMQLEHALDLKVFDGVVVRAVLWFQHWPCENDMFKHLEHEIRVLVQSIC
jgi:hypothetical protein